MWWFSFSCFQERRQIIFIVRKRGVYFHRFLYFGFGQKFPIVPPRDIIVREEMTLPVFALSFVFEELVWFDGSLGKPNLQFGPFFLHVLVQTTYG